MNITDKLEAIKAKHRAKREIKTYDHCRIYPHNNRPVQVVTIGQAKAQRLRVKNLRRADNGLPPKATYAEI